MADITHMPVFDAAKPSMQTPRVGVVIATVRRAEEVAQLLDHLARQTLRPTLTVLSVEGDADLPHPLPEEVEIVAGRRGLTAQRNRGLEKILSECDIVVFFDDDFVPADDALARLASLFTEYPHIVAATGLVLRDGVKQGGISYQDAVEALQAHRLSDPAPIVLDPTDELYGCNMAIRVAAIGSLRFDERLPLYGWQEDVDFAGQLLRRGRVVRTNAFAGVHRGVNKGRSKGLALGYSQMVNPVYLVRKGTMRPAKAARLMARNFISNHARLFRPEPFIDRVGRSLGNWLGLLAVLLGKPDPGAAATIGSRPAVR